MKQLTFDELLNKLSEMDGKKWVIFDFGGFTPGNLGSYRGNYKHIAIDPIPYKSIRVEEFYRYCLRCLGTDFEGWKGGDYTLTGDTLVYVAAPGECSGTALVDVIPDEGNPYVVLKTEYIPGGFV